MRVAVLSDYGTLGQYSGLVSSALPIPPLGQLPSIDGERRYGLRGQILVSKDGAELLRPGWIFANSVYYKKFYSAPGQPDDRDYAAVIGLDGPRKGKMDYIPYDTLRNSYLIVQPDLVQQALASIPSPMPLTTADVTLATFERSLKIVSQFASSAMRVAQQGDVATAKSWLRTAWEDWDRSIIELRILRSFDEVNEENYNLLRAEVQKLANEVLIPASQTVQNLSDADFLTKAVNFVQGWANAIAGNLRYLVKWKFDKVAKAYGLIVRKSQRDEATIKELEVVTPRSAAIDSIIKSRKASLVTLRSRIASMEGTFQRYGIDFTELRKEAGLGAEPVSTLTILTVASLVLSILSILYFIIRDLVDRYQAGAPEREARKQLAAGEWQRLSPILVKSDEEDVKTADELAKLFEDPQLRANTDLLREKARQEGVPVPPKNGAAPPPSDAGVKTPPSVYFMWAAGAVGVIGLIWYLKTRDR